MSSKNGPRRRSRAADRTDAAQPASGDASPPETLPDAEAQTAAAEEVSDARPSETSSSPVAPSSGDSASLPEDPEALEVRKGTSPADEGHDYGQLILTEVKADDLREGLSAVRALKARLNILQAEHRKLIHAGFSSAEDALRMIAETERKFVSLYQDKKAVVEGFEGDDDEALRQRYKALFDDLELIRTTLGVETTREALDMVTSMQDQLEGLYAEKNSLAKVGLAGIDDALEMIRSMEDQLKDLYREKEFTYQIMKASEEGDIFEQMQSLYAEREIITRELGVESPEAAVELLRSLQAQLDTFFSDRELFQEELQVSEGQDVVNLVKSLEEQLLTLYKEREELAEMGLGTPSDIIDMIGNMEEQLDELYGERDTLTQNGWEKAAEAVAHIEDQHETVDDLKTSNQQLAEERTQLAAENKSLHAQLGYLRDELGMDDPGAIVQLIRSMEDQLCELYEERDEIEQDRLIAVGNAPSFVPLEALAEIDTTPEQDLDLFSFGILRLSDDGTVEYLNPRGRQFPGLEDGDVVGHNFFFELAPTVNNGLFHGRFKQGVTEGHLNVRFPYTFIRTGDAPVNLVVHLHRKPDAGLNWVLFKRL